MVEAGVQKSYKIVMLGDAGVGKTCIVNRYIKGAFSDTEATLGSNYSAKVIEISPKGVMQPIKVKLQIWDTAGGEQFRSLTHIYYKDASAVCLCYDSTSEESYDSLSYWADELRGKSDNDNIIMAIVATKTDWVDRAEVPLKTAKAYAQSLNATYMQTSALDGTGISQLYTQLAEKLYLQDLAGNVVTPSNKNRDGNVDLRTPKASNGVKTIPGDDKKKGCC